jgi:transposase
MVREAKGLLLAADGVANAQIAERLGVSRSTVLGWRKQFADDGVKGVGKILPGRGPKTSIPQEKIDQVVHDTRHTTPPDATHWSVRSMAKHAGISKSKVQQIWSARGLKPHLVETFKLSNDTRTHDLSRVKASPRFQRPALSRESAGQAPDLRTAVDLC